MKSTAKKALVVLTKWELSAFSVAVGARVAAEGHLKHTKRVLEQTWYQIESNRGLNHDFCYTVSANTGEVHFKHEEDNIADFVIRLQRKII